MNIRCTFRPQAWQNDYAIPVDPEGPVTWEAEVERLPEPFSYESDGLREVDSAPVWAGQWEGPFEVAYEVLVDGEWVDGEEAYAKCKPERRTA